MFKIYDERAAIYRIQEYLHFIRDRTYHELPPITPDGVFGEETRLAVEAFQGIYGIEKSGIVDYETNEAIYSVYLNGRGEDSVSITDLADLPLSFGKSSLSVLILNMLLSELRASFADIPRVSKDNYFGKSTENAVKALETMFGYKVSGIVDEKLYKRILREVIALRSEGYGV